MQYSKFIKFVLIVFILVFAVSLTSAQDGQHCVAELLPNNGGTVEKGCFDTLAESVAFATNNRIVQDSYNYRN